MAALHTTPDSPATQLERVEDGSECDLDQEEEEEEEKGKEVEDEEEEEIVVEEEEEEDMAEVVEEEQVQEVAEVEVEAELEDEDDEDNDMEEVLAEEQSPGLGNPESVSHGGDAKSPVLQEKGKEKPIPGGGSKKGWGGPCQGLGHAREYSGAP